MKWYIKALKNYVNFNGRARRSEFWMFYLFNVIIIFLLIFFSFLPALIAANTSLYSIPMFIIFLYYLFILLPYLAVTVRRLHDTGRSGWNILLGFIPLVGAIWLLVLLCIDSDSGDNAYGPNPKLTEAAFASGSGTLDGDIRV